MNTQAPSSNPLPNLGKNCHYRIIRKIGQGGMSVVYEAFDERLKRSVALKLLHPFLAQTAEYKTRFLREAQAVARLTHPNILQIYDVSSGDQLYLVTELLSGGTLSEKAQHLNFIELPELGAMIIAQVAKALEHAHSRGIIHRDIKPENIMITNDGQLKLMDFGIASIGSDESLTQAGTLLGSLAHVAPEVIKGEAATPASDIYSLSTVFFWLLSGHLPFKGDSPHALLKAIVDKPAQKIQHLTNFISDSLALIIEQGMHKNPQERYKNAGEMANNIENALVHMGLSFDLNKLTALLHKPEEELEGFKKMLLTNIKNQAIIYKQNNLHAQALALECRLEPIVRTAKTKTIKFNFFKFYAYAIVLLGFMTLSLSIFFIYNKKEAAEVNIISPLPSLPLELKEYESEPSSLEDLPPAPTPTPESIKTAQAIHVQKPVILQELVLSIWPFASIIVDGKNVVNDVKYYKINLDPGVHRLKFVHPYAATVEKIVHIKATKAPLELSIIMNRTKPAFLRIHCEPEANVAVNGIFKGSSAKSLKRPIVVAMPDKTHSIKTEIIVQRDGFKPVLIPTTFIAGQTQEINVTLVPQVLKSGDQHL